MKFKEVLAAALLCLPIIYTIIMVFLAFKELNPFLILGFMSLILLMHDFLTEVMVLTACASVSASLALLYLGYPFPILSLASGYFMASVLLVLAGVKSNAKPHVLLIVYLLSILVGMVFLNVSRETLTPYTFLPKFVNRLLSLPSGVNEFSDPIFLILMAPSVIGFLTAIPVGNVPIMSCREFPMAMFLAALPLLIISALSREIAWIASILSVSAASTFLILYLRSIK